MILLSIIPRSFFLMRSLSFAAVGLLISFACTPQFANANSVKPTKAVSSAELEFRDQMALTDYQKIEYQDTNGSSITFVQFQKKLSESGFSMEKSKVGEQATAIVKLQSGKTKAPKVKYKLAAGSPFPAFKLHATDGNVVDNEALRGKYTVVSFYFSECAPCIKEVPMLNAFAERNKEFSTLAVTFDSPDEAKKFAQRTRLSWRTVAGAEELIGQIGVKSYPTFALLDPNGVLVTIENGFDAAGKGTTLDKWVKSAIASRTQ
ncbi:redoxin family protein [Rugamonas sp. FT103W]|uniref:Redoxin family protein n=2 Tax=Rugamonas rivuli TaxID=2743358 RepID=A0A843SA81_9BURK|nr:redoxin family protein [Rugamonas rivuli]